VATVRTQTPAWRCQRRTAAFFGMGWKRIGAAVLSDHTGQAA